MKPTKQLIRALRETAHKLRNGTRYEWLDSANCNCGVLAQTIMDIDGDALDRRIPWGCWTFAAEKYCPVTGLPLHDVFAALRTAGIEWHDYKRIEYCDGSGPAIYQSRDAVAAWMDREADELERRRIAEHVAAKEAK
jgi:hypothetical protein